MTTIECAACGKEIQRGNYIDGQIVCANCAMQDEPKPYVAKNVTDDIRAFSTIKRRRRRWR